MKVTNELNKEITLTHTATSRFLLKKGRAGADAFALYNFYCYVASWQQTNDVKATDEFCMKGLYWGRTRFFRAKKLLAESNIVSAVTKRSDEGKIKGHYVHVRPHKKRSSRTKNDSVVLSTGSQQTTNAYESNLNANENNIISAHAQNGKSFQSLRDTISNLPDPPSNGGAHYEWQDYASRMAEKLSIKKPSRSWFKFIRDAFKNNRRGLVDSTYASVIDLSVTPKDMEKYFYKVFYSKL